VVGISRRSRVLVHPSYLGNRSQAYVVTGLKRLPLLFAAPYLLLTYALFWLGPFHWPVKAMWVPVFFVPACFAALACGFLLGTRKGGRASDFRASPALFAIGAIAAILLLIPTTVTYTGHMPWDVGRALVDQQEAYSALADQLAATAGSRGPVAALRALSGPFIFCVLPLGVMLWPRLSLVRRMAVVATVLISIDLSILRGTTRELVDILVIGCSAYVCRIAAMARAEKRNLAMVILRRWKGISFAAVVLLLVLTALVGRTEARAGGKMATCIGYSQICADLTSGPYASMSDTFAFGSAAITGYLAQGYYGLSLAGEKEPEPTFGIGHSPPLAALFVNLGGDETWANRTLTFRNRVDLWSDETQWSTMWAWVANDVGFTGAFLFTLALGWLWGKTWLDTLAGDLRAAVLFCLVMMTIFYAPANLQLAATLEGYATVAFWLGIWAIGRTRRGKIDSSSA
jgi:hypothetical protein